MISKPKGRPASSTDFNVELFERCASDMKSGRIPLKDMTLSDNIVKGLRAKIRKTGHISFHVQYDPGHGSRPYLKIGEHPGMTIPEARNIARTIWSLAEKGIDPEDGLHDRLIRELKEKGDKWRP